MNTPVYIIVPSPFPAIRIGLRPFAAQFRTTPIISKELGKLLLFILRTVRTIIMDIGSVEEFGSAI
jgi:hypothetical protein